MNVHEMGCKVYLLLGEEPGIDSISVHWWAHQRVLSAHITGPGAVAAIRAIAGATEGDWHAGRTVDRHESGTETRVEIWRQRAIEVVVDGIRIYAVESERATRLVKDDEVTVSGSPLAAFLWPANPA